jgi:hypothetical protein
MTRVMGIMNQIRLTDETITDQCIVIEILESKDLSSFSIDELIGSMVTHET